VFRFIIPDPYGAGILEPSIGLGIDTWAIQGSGSGSADPRLFILDPSLVMLTLFQTLVLGNGFYFLLFTFADPDPAFHSDADPDLTSQIYCTVILFRTRNNCDLESFLSVFLVIIWALIKCA
jgi:hypothetical protein